MAQLRSCRVLDWTSIAYQVSLAILLLPGRGAMSNCHHNAPGRDICYTHTHARRAHSPESPRQVTVSTDILLAYTGRYSGEKNKRERNFILFSFPSTSLISTIVGVRSCRFHILPFFLHDRLPMTIVYHIQCIGLYEQIVQYKYTIETYRI